jgi:hypothetical protein
MSRSSPGQLLCLSSCQRSRRPPASLDVRSASDSVAGNGVRRGRAAGRWLHERARIHHATRCRLGLGNLCPCRLTCWLVHQFRDSSRAVCNLSLRYSCGYNICHGLNGIFGRHRFSAETALRLAYPSFTILADAYSQVIPRNSALDSAFACCPGTRDPVTPPPLQRSAAKTPEINRG